jgi:HEPN domain-containing protein
MTRAVDSKKAANYMKKADDYMYLARIAIKEGRNDSATSNAIHGTINALDALTTSYLSKRASGTHTDVLLLVKGIFDPVEYQDIQKQFTALISLKNTSEYQPDLMDSADAQNALKWAERIIKKVKVKLKDSV